jgi:hypothetical protein
MVRAPCRLGSAECETVRGLAPEAKEVMSDESRRHGVLVGDRSGSGLRVGLGHASDVVDVGSAGS